MKKNLFYLILLAATISFVACDSDDKDLPFEEIPITFSTDGVYMINEGNYNSGNMSTLSYYSTTDQKLFMYKDAEGTPSEDIFKYQNEKIREEGLGVGAQDMVIYGSKMYITTTKANNIYVTDLNAKLQKYANGKPTIINSDKAGNKLEGPRSVIAHNGYVYASYYSGHIAKIDTMSMEIVETISDNYSKLDEMTIVDDKLYVIESQDPHTRVAVVNLGTFKLETPLTLSVVNPYRIASDKPGNIFILSLSTDWGSKKNTLTHIMPNGERIITPTVAREMCLIDDKLVLADITGWGDSQTTELQYYDIQNKEVVEESILKVEDNAIKNALNSLYKISIDPNNQDIYVSSSNFTTTSTMLVFSKDGEYKTKFSTGGLGTAKAYFVSKPD